MITLTTIRNDLKDIRYYFSRKAIFDQEMETIGVNSICLKIEEYNKAVCFAPPRLFDLYISLYKENNTQESLADKLGYTNEYISKLNKQLIKFLFDYFNGKEEIDNE